MPCASVFGRRQRRFPATEHRIDRRQLRGQRVRSILPSLPRSAHGLLPHSALEGAVRRRPRGTRSSKRSRAPLHGSGRIGFIHRLDPAVSDQRTVNALVEGGQPLRPQRVLAIPGNLPRLPPSKVTGAKIRLRCVIERVRAEISHSTTPRTRGRLRSDQLIARQGL